MADNNNTSYHGNESGGRKFYSIPSGQASNRLREASRGGQALLGYIRDNLVGNKLTFRGPFGHRRVLYCDYTASSRSLTFLEEYVRDNVLPYYGNTHTTTSITSLQTTMFRHEARDIVRRCVNAGEQDAVIFTGHGCTGAVHRLIHGLNLTAPPLVLVSPYEHHSNLLPWKEIGAEIIWIKQNTVGEIDIADLEEQLRIASNQLTDRRRVIGCFSAASNITGILTDVDAVATTLHRYSALAFFDYATAGPYVRMDMNPQTSEHVGLAYKDALFCSPHKFVGGPSTAGVLVAKKTLFVNEVPSGAGGGSVFYVTENSHRYLKEIEMREEGGTPPIIESVRTGLVFQLKEEVTVETITSRDDELVERALARWKTVENLHLLGSTSARRLPIFSFVIRHAGTGRLLHHNYVSALLNDLFGIQSRGGCACAGPYAQQLLGMSEQVALQIEKLLLEDQRLDRHHLRRHREYSEKEVFRPGFTRLNFAYFLTDEDVSFVLEAVAIVAEHGWKLLPGYKMNPETGEWWQRDHQVYKERKWLGSIKYDHGRMEYSKDEPQDTPDYAEMMKIAEDLLSSTKKHQWKSEQQISMFDEAAESLRWFLLPMEAKRCLSGTSSTDNKQFKMPFFPGREVASSGRRVPAGMNFHYCACSRLQMRMLEDNVSSNHPNSGPVSYNEEDERTETEGDEQMKRTNQLCNGVAETIECGLANEIPVADSVSDSTARLTISDNSNLERVRSDADKQSRMLIPSTEEQGCVVGTEETPGTSLPCLLPRDDPVPPNDMVPPVNVVDNGTSVRSHRVRKFVNPPKALYSPVVQAIDDFGMIRNGDRILLCLSGGKDSLSMLHIIRQYQFTARKQGVTFEIGAMTVDPQSRGYDPRPLIPYLAELEIPYFYEEQNIIQQASELPECASICSFCSRMKRGRMYACARREQFNVIALGQHLDDLAESFMMSTFHNGLLRTMKAHYTIQERDLRVIRPLVYVREKLLRSFAETNFLPVIPENCPACFEAPKERHRMKQLLAQQELSFPTLFSSLLSSMKPLMAITDAERGTSEANKAIFQDLSHGAKLELEK